MKRHAKDFINHRGLKDFATVRPDDSISDALNVLWATNCSAVLELDQDKRNFSKIQIYSFQQSQEAL